jgi:hypothetical protein
MLFGFFRHFIARITASNELEKLRKMSMSFLQQFYAHFSWHRLILNSG